MNVSPPFCLVHHRPLHCSSPIRRASFIFTFTIFASAILSYASFPFFPSVPSKTASATAPPHSQILSSSTVETFASARPTPSGHHQHRHKRDESLTGANSKSTSFPKQRAQSFSSSASKDNPGVARCTILRPPAVRLANPVNHVPRITPVAVPHPWQLSDENLPLEARRDAYPLLTIPEQRRSRVSPSPSSLVVERSQGETESWRTSIAVPQGQRCSGTLADANANAKEHRNDNNNIPGTAERMAAFEAKEIARGDSLRPPEQAHLPQDVSATPRTADLHRPRHVPSQVSLRSQSQIASIPSNTGQHTPGGDAEMAEELAWGPAHPCFPHINPHVPTGSPEYMSTRIIRIRRDWMVKGDLAPTFSNLYPEILDPLLSEQEFRKIIATINDELIKAFDPFRLQNWFDGALGLVTGWLWEDLGAPAIKRHLQRVETWLENWNREIGAKDGVHIWSLRRTAYMSLDIQIPDPKVGIIHGEDPSLPGTRPSTGVGRGV